jgi:hypothetical protein
VCVSWRRLFEWRIVVFSFADDVTSQRHRRGARIHLEGNGAHEIVDASGRARGEQVTSSTDCSAR